MMNDWKDVEVFPPGAWENNDGPTEWYAIADETGIFAYVSTEERAETIADAIAAARQELMPRYLG
jgi:hypothetical protein